MGSPEIAIAESLAATAIIPSLLAITFIVAFTVTLILLIRKKRNSQETLIEAEANYSTIGPPMPPVRIERNMSYEQRAVHTEETDTNSFMEANNSVVLDDIGLQQLLVLHEPGTESIPKRNFTVNNTSLEGEPLPTEYESTSEGESNTHEYDQDQPRGNITGATRTVTHTMEMASNPAYGTDVSIAPEVETQSNLAYEHSHPRMT